MTKRTVKLNLSYDGSGFYGWQVQPKLRTVQGEVNSALKQITGEDINVMGAGRTDAGVHALDQYASFKTSNTKIADENFLKALNSLLPCDVRVLNVETVSPSFHARNTAVKKIYAYHIFNGKVLSPFKRNYCYQYHFKLNADKMARALKMIEGKHDFSAFRSSHCCANNPVKTIFSTSAEVDGDFIVLKVCADGFLQHMMRTITGTVIMAGEGRIVPDDLSTILNSGKRENAGPTAPGKGLFLEKVVYP